MLKNTIVFALVAGLVFAVAPAGAQDIYQWDTVAGGDNVVQDGGGAWQVGGGNWYGQTTPGNDQNWADGNDAVFGGGTGGAAGTVTVSGTVAPSKLILDQPFGGGNYTIGGGTIDIAVAGGITVNATGTTTISSDVTSTDGAANSVMSINTVNAGSTLNLSGGAAGDPTGWAYGMRKVGPGTLELSGVSEFGSGVPYHQGISALEGKLVISGDVTVGDENWVPVNGVMDITGTLTSGGATNGIYHNGVVNLSGTGRWNMWCRSGYNTLSDGAGGDTVLNIRDDAVLDVDRTKGPGPNNQWSTGGLALATGWTFQPTDVCKATVNQDGGTVNLPVTVAPGNGLSGVVGGQGLILGGVITTGNGSVEPTYNLNGGLLYTSGVYNLSGLWDGGTVIVDPATYNQTAIFNFNGGTLKASQSDSTVQGVIDQGNNHFMGNLTHAWVKAGGAIIDTNSFNASIDQALEHDPALGGSPDGGLQKLGEGTLTLLRESDYTGDTSVEAGVLEIMHAFLDDASSVSIFSDAMMNLNFTGSDTIAGLTLGGAAKGAGTYDSTTDPLFFTGLGSLLVGDGAVVPGDTNGDGIVNDADLANFEAQFGGAPGAESADFDGDGDVDIHDFSTMRGNWGFGTGPAPLSSAATPEPTTMGLLALGGLVVLKRRRS